MGEKKEPTRSGLPLVFRILCWHSGHAIMMWMGVIPIMTCKAAYCSLHFDPHDRGAGLQFGGPLDGPLYYVGQVGVESLSWQVSTFLLEEARLAPLAAAMAAVVLAAFAIFIRQVRVRARSGHGLAPEALRELFTF